MTKITITLVGVVFNTNLNKDGLLRSVKSRFHSTLPTTSTSSTTLAPKEAALHLIVSLFLTGTKVHSVLSPCPSNDQYNLLNKQSLGSDIKLLVWHTLTKINDIGSEYVIK